MSRTHRLLNNITDFTNFATMLPLHLTDHLAHSTLVSNMLILVPRASTVGDIVMRLYPEYSVHIVINFSFISGICHTVGGLGFDVVFYLEIE